MGMQLTDDQGVQLPRIPVEFQGQRVPGLYKRGDVFEFRGRIHGQGRTQKLSARTVGEARREVEALRSGAASSDPSTRTLLALADECFTVWGVEVRNGKRKARTVETGVHRFHRWVAPVIGKRPVGALNLSDIRRLLDSIDAAPATATGALHVLSAILGYGVEIGELERNLVHDVPRNWRPGTRRTKEPRVLNADEVKRLLDGMGAYRPHAALCYYGGLRISEALGLRWGDVDFRAGTITVNGQRTLDGGYDRAKTSASAAPVPLLPALARELKSLLPANAIPHPAAPIFTTGNKDNARRAFRVAGDRAGLNADKGAKPVSPHDLRHSIGSELLAQGWSLPEVSRFLRHSSPEITARYYAHVMDASLGSAVERLTRSGFGA
jgi:integrase